MDLVGYGDGLKTFLPQYLIDDINNMRYRHEINCVNLKINSLAADGTDPFTAVTTLMHSLNAVSDSFRFRINNIHAADVSQTRDGLLQLVAHCIAFITGLDYSYYHSRIDDPIRGTDDDFLLDKIVALANQDVPIKLPPEPKEKGMFDGIEQNT